VSLDCRSGTGFVEYTPPPATAVDACGPVTIESAGTGPFGTGTNNIVFIANDASGNQSVCVTEVTVHDAEAPRVTVSSGEAGEIWPPNGELRTVTLADCGIHIVDRCEGRMDAMNTGSITSVSSDEEMGEDDGAGDSAPASDDSDGTEGRPTRDDGPDIVIVNRATVQLRAERDADGDGRVYTIEFVVTDLGGNQTAGTCHAWVPRHRGEHPHGRARRHVGVDR
jgi:hypothetical protein